MKRDGPLDDKASQDDRIDMRHICEAIVSPTHVLKS